MDPERRTPEALDAYIADTFKLHDPLLDRVNRRAAESGLPPIQVSLVLGRFLGILCASVGARRVLEVGTLAGFSTIHLARALPEGGELVTLEFEPVHASVARENICDAGLDGVVTVIEGDARVSLEALSAGRAEPFDFVFIDADKSGYPGYLGRCIELCRPGGLIVADNALRGGRVNDLDPGDVDSASIAEFNRLAAADPRVEASILQIVGSKGHDGLALLRVLPG